MVVLRLRSANRTGKRQRGETSESAASENAPLLGRLLQPERLLRETAYAVGVYKVTKGHSPPYMRATSRNTDGIDVASDCLR